VGVKDNILIKVLRRLSKSRSSWKSFAAVSFSISMEKMPYPVELQEVAGTVRVVNVDGARKRV